MAERVVALTLTDPPAEATHWTAAMMPRHVGFSVSSVQRIWCAHGLRPHRVREFKLSNDPIFVEKLRDVVGLYVDPPAQVVVAAGFWGENDEHRVFSAASCPRLSRGAGQVGGCEIILKDPTNAN